MIEETEGFVEVDGFRLFYRSFGRPAEGPVLLGLHGGPGASHDYLVPLRDFADRGYRVVLFDQLGCGRSEIPEDHSLFTIQHHIVETESIRTSLSLGRVHLLGSSYGGLLGLSFALSHPESIRSLTTVGGLASIPLTVAEMRRLVTELPPRVRETIERCESTGTTNTPEFQEAALEFYRRHLCRLDPFPVELTRSLEYAQTRPVYPYMNGPSEFTITGTIRDVDISGELSRIRTPTLVLGGRFDEVTPKVAEQIRSGVPGARSVTFADSSHVPFWEERSKFTDTLADFLDSVEKSGTPNA